MNLHDLLHRVVWTFVQAFVGALTASALIPGLDVSILEAAALAGLGDVLVVVKEYARYQLGGTDR